MPVPEFFSVESVERVARVPYQERARQAVAWARTHRIPPAADDQFRVGLLCVDVQNTFCLPEFELFVSGRSGRGAMDDNARLCRFIYRNLARITEVVSTIDTHEAVQIFHPVFWVNEASEHPNPYTEIFVEQVEKGEWRANAKIAHALGWEPSELQRHALYYVRALAGRYPLMIWPYHSMLGGVGHALVAGVEEAIFFHALARETRARFETKGRNPLTENYSVLRPEVLDTYTGEPIGRENTDLVQRLLGYDALIVAGQAKSHCVVWTLNDLLLETRKREGFPTPLIYLLEDCMSPVVVPGADFTEAADAAFARFESAGMHIVRSTDEMEAWPQLAQTRHVG